MEDTMDRKIGAQFYTLRDHTQTIEDFDATCKRISEMGYKTVQISGTPLGAKEMREVLDKYGLVALTSHRSPVDFIERIDEVIEYNKTLGCTLCGMGEMPLEARYTEEDLDKFINDMKGICEKLKANGLKFGYHNHAFEFKKRNGRFVIDRLIEETDPEIFNFIVDVYWLQYGGVNPQEFIEKLGKRAIAIHFKDYSVDYVDKKTVVSMKEVGYGNLDWDKIIEACDKAGSLWAFVEHDYGWTTDDPFDSLEMSYKFLETKGFN